jgi:hypothetical protein
MKPPPSSATRVQQPTANQPAVPAAPAPAPSAADSAAELAAVRPNRTPLIVGGLLLVVLLLVAAIVAVGRGPDDTRPALPGGTVADVPKPEAPPKVDPPPPVTPPVTPPVKEEPKAPAIVKLTLEATPPQAEVYEDDILLGATPLTISRPPGTLTSLRLEAKGYQPLSRKVRFESDTSLKLELEKDAVKVKKPGGGGGGKPKPPGDDDLMDLPE